MNWGEKLGILIDLERELKDESTESKLTRFGSRLAEKSKSKLGKKLPNMKRDKFKIKYKVNLIYDSTLQSNDTRWKIRRKSHNLTKDND